MNNGATKGCMPEVFATLKSQPGLQAVYQCTRICVPTVPDNNVAEERIANLEKNCAGNTIRLSVAADGKRYRVSLPHSGHAQEFMTKQK